MKTEAIIAALVADSERPVRLLPERLILVVAPVALASAAFFYELYGMRDDWMAALFEPRFLFKLVFTALLAAAVWPLLCSAGRPLTIGRSQFRLLACVLVLFVAALMVETFSARPAEWTQRLVGDNGVFCLLAIPSLGIPLLAVILVVLRYAAPANGTRAGMMAGLFAGACASLIYASHCPDDSPLFVAAWYGAAIIVLMGVGAIAGRMALRW